MRRAVGTVCLTIVMTAGMLMLTAARCESQPVDVQIHLRLNEDPVRIWVQDTGKFVGLCRTKESGPENHCTGNQITWRLLVTPAAAWDETTDKLYIYNAPNHPICFGPDPVATFTEHNQEQGSGVPSLVCTGDKYGTYWPYVIEYWSDEEFVVSTDPGGIIFP